MGRLRRRGAGGQASVELALVLPVLVVVLAVVVQVGLVVRDRVLVVHATRVAGRAVVVDPSGGSAALAAARATDGRARVRVGGDRRPGGLAEVTVELSPATVPLVGRAVSGLRLRERLVVLVEG